MAYEIIISNEVFSALNAVVLYLEKRWSKKVAENFLFIFYDKVNAIANNPNIGRKTNKDSDIRKILITKHNMLYYEVSGNRIELLTIFFTIQDPLKNKFE